MDKYQINLLNKISFVVKEEGASFSISEECATAVQPENAYIEEIQVTANSSVLKCIIIDDVKIEIVNNSAHFVISFKNDSKEITFCFINGIADDCTLPIKLYKTSKEKWDEKINLEKRAQLINDVALVVNNGNDLINVIFTMIKHSKYAIAELFYENRKIGEFKNKENQSFISITGLAFGNYKIAVSLFDESDELIIKTDLVSTQLKPIAPDLSSIEHKLEEIAGNTEDYIVGI